MRLFKSSKETTGEPEHSAEPDKGLLNPADSLMDSMLSDPKILQMNNYIQHGKVTSYQHVKRVAAMSLAISRFFHLKTDEEVLVRAALLHDYYLYDWHGHGDHLHGYHHPFIAAENAARDFHVSEKELECIRTHMWPLNIKRPPASKEAAIICIADKLCSLDETLRMRK